jgi:uncharacterized membrane protein
MKKLLITTALGGVMFLIPLVIVVAVIGKAYSIMKMLAEPLQRFLPIESIAGIGAVEILAIILMFLFSLAVGLLAKGKRAKAIYAKLDGVILELVPGYAWTKSVVHNLAGAGDAAEFLPVLVRLDDQTQIAFELERAANGQVVVFLPGAPDAKSGTLAYVDAERVESANATFLEINRSLKLMGHGAARFLSVPPPSNGVR